MPAPRDLVHESSTDTGTKSFTLSAVSGKVRFSDTGHGFGSDTGGLNTFDYYISNRAAAQWERGTGHMSDANTLVRDTVTRSSAVSDAKVSFSTGTKDVTNDVPAQYQSGGVLATRGDLIYRDATRPARLAVGTSGQVLGSNGTDPVWVNGGWRLLAKGSVSNAAAFEFDLAAYNAEFTTFKVFVRDLLPQTDNTDLYLRMSDDGGSTFEADASDYAWVSHRLPLATATTDGLATGDDADTKMQIHNAIGNATDEGISLEITILNPQASTQGRVLWAGIFRNLAGAHLHVDGGGVALWSTAKTDFQLLMSSGNLSMSYSVFGVS